MRIIDRLKLNERDIEDLLSDISSDPELAKRVLRKLYPDDEEFMEADKKQTQQMIAEIQKINKLF